MGLDKEILLYPHNGILLEFFKKEWGKFTHLD